MKILRWGLLALLWLAPAAHAAEIRQITLPTNDMVYDRVSKKIYATVPASAGSIGNSVTVIDPLTGAVGPSVFIGSDPGKVVISDNGQYLYVSLDGSASIRRFDVATRTAGIQFTLGTGYGPNYAEDMAVMPGHPETLAVSKYNRGISPRMVHVALYDNGVQRPKVAAGANNITFGATGARIYGQLSELSSFDFVRWNVDDTGIVSGDGLSCLICHPASIQFEGGRLFESGGGVYDPEARTRLGGVAGGAIRPDAALRRIFVIPGASPITLLSFDWDTFLQVGSLPIPGTSGGAGSLICWGDDGLAFRTADNRIFFVRDSDLILGPPPFTVTLAPPSLVGGASGSGTVTLDTPAPAGGATVALAADSPAVTLPASLTVPAGATTATFPIATQPVAAPTPVTLTVSVARRSRSVTLTLQPPGIAALTLQPASVPGGTPATGTLTLNGAAPAGGATVTLTSDHPGVAAVPTTLAIPAGATTGAFPVTTQTVTSATTVRITASLSGSAQTATLTVLPNLPAAPSELAVRPVSPTQLLLTWTDNSRNETGFEIERSTGSAAFSRIAAIGPDSNTFTDTGLRPSTLYRYRVRAASASGPSPYSNEASATTPLAPARIAVLRPSTHEWFLRNDDGSATVIQFGGPEDRPVPGDYLGAGTAQIAVFRPSTREWFLRSDSGARSFASPGPGDVPVPADYQGAAHLQIAVYLSTTAEWFLRGDSGGLMRVPFGAPGDVPVPADYFGLGHASIAVMRPSTHEWFLRKEDGSTVRIQFGGPEDQPVPADYLGTGRAQIAVLRPSTHEWFVRREDGSAVHVVFGEPEDLPVPADYLGLGHAQFAVMRPRTHDWLILAGDGSTLQIQFGGVEDLPVPAPYPAPVGALSESRTGR